MKSFRPKPDEDRSRQILTDEFVGALRGALKANIPASQVLTIVELAIASTRFARCSKMETEELSERTRGLVRVLCGEMELERLHGN